MKNKTFTERLDEIFGLNEDVEYPCGDQEHTQSAIGYIMKYKDRKDASGTKARRNKPKVAAAAKRFGINLPEDW